ncbi:hypothetical protein PMAYCL1PPCAC_16889, partial [Pristionchus mayeri]
IPEWVGIVLYAVILVRIGCSPDPFFKTPFYTFFITTGIYGIISVISFMVGARLHLTPPWAWIFKLSWVLNQIGAMGSLMGKLVIVIHRRAVLNSVDLMENRWSRACVRRLILVQFSIPFASTATIYFYDYKYTEKGGTQLVATFADEDLVTSKIIVTIGYFGYVVATIVFAFLTSKSLAKLSSIVGEGNIRRKILRQQRVMFIIVAFCVFSHFIKAVHQILWGISTLLGLSGATAAIVPYYSLANGLATYTAPVVLFICSSKGRRLFIPRFAFPSSS